MRPADADDLADFLRALPLETPVHAIGACSNLIIRDGGLPGVTIRLARGFTTITPETDGIIAGAAALDMTVAEHAAAAGLGDLEFLSGIPGTIGGAVVMNGGAYGGDIAGCLDWAEVVTRSGDFLRLSAADLAFAYRHARLPHGAVVVRARLRARPGATAVIAARMAEIRTTREATQPIRARTGGSTFRNPPNMKAWELIDSAGCRGLTRGGAVVSEKHCNFLINAGGASAADLEGLGEEVRRRVFARNRREAGMGNPPHRGVGNGTGCDHGTPPTRRTPPPDPLPQGGGNDSGCGALRRNFRRAGSKPLERSPGDRGVAAGRVRCFADRGRRGPGGGNRRAGSEAGRRVQRAARKIWGGRRDPGRARLARHSLYPFRPARVVPGDGQGGGQGRLRRRRAAGGKGLVVDTNELETADPIPLPYVVKPINEGSSVGVEIMKKGDNRRAEVARSWRFGTTALVEEYIPGRELTVGVMGDRPLAVTEIIAEAGVFYDYDSKYADGGSRHIIPARCIRMPTAAHWTWRWRHIARLAAAARRGRISVTTTPAASPDVWCCWKSTRSPDSRPPRCCRNKPRITA